MGCACSDVTKCGSWLGARSHARFVLHEADYQGEFLCGKWQNRTILEQVLDKGFLIGKHNPGKVRLQYAGVVSARI